MLSVLAGRPDLADVTPPAAPLRVGLAMAPPVQGVRLDGEHRRATEETARALSAAGHSLQLFRFPTPTWAALAALGRWFAGTLDDAERLDRTKLGRRIRVHAAIGARARRHIRPEQRERFRTAVQRAVFDRFDVVLTPTLAQPPIAATAWGERGWLANMQANIRFAPYAAPWNLAGYPGIAVPAGIHRRAGTPLSVQLVTTLDGEGQLLSLAAQLEEQNPWQRLAPGLD
jgi:amidase